jgi:hypothetical protein
VTQSAWLQEPAFDGFDPTGVTKEPYRLSDFLRSHLRESVAYPRLPSIQRIIVASVMCVIASINNMCIANLSMHNDM